MGKDVLRNGWLELRRKWHRRRLRKRLAEHDRERAALLGKVGELAWTLGVDLAGHPELREEISALEGRAGELAASASTLDAQRAALEERWRAESGRFDGLRAAAEAEKRPVDAELASARGNLARQESAVREAGGRLNALGVELARLRERIGASSEPEPAGSDDGVARARARVAELAAGRGPATEELRLAQEAVAPLAAEVGRLTEASRSHAAAIERIEAERKNALRAIEGELKSVRGQIASTGASARSVGQARWARLVRLGTALHAGDDVDPRLAEADAAVTAEDRARAVTEASLEASMAETRAMPPNAMATFAAAALALLLVLLALPVGGYAAWQWRMGGAADEALEDEWLTGDDATAGEAEESVEAEPPPINPYLQHELMDRRPYVLADRLAGARDRDEARAALLEAFRAIGLGVYRPDGTAVQRGAERGQADFFLYDFQLAILARSQAEPSYLTLTDLSHVLGVELGELEDPSGLRPVLAEAMSLRYEEAARSPADPASFIVLFLDGLARRQPIPYSLGEVRDQDADYVQVSPVQSLLLVMEFFMQPPRPVRAGFSLPWPRGLLPRLAEADPCDMISGDAQKNYGRGSDLLVELAGMVEGGLGKLASVIGNVTGVIGAAGDMLTLYGIQIHLQPQPYTIHLLHEEDFVAGIEANVTFDGEIVSDEVLRCGWMAGKQMPVKGPLPGVDLTWEFSPVLPPYLEMHRQMMDFLTGHLGLHTKTDEGGSSTFLIQPMPCPARRGRIRGQDYMATVSARVVTADIPMPSLGLGPGLILKLGPGTIEYLMGGRKGYVRFRAEWHQERPDDDQYQSRRGP